MSDSVRPHRRQPTGLSRPWDSPGKNTGVGCRCLLQCMKVRSESESEVIQSCPTLATPWTAAFQAPPSMGFSRQEYWSGVPLPSPTEEPRDPQSPVSSVYPTLPSTPDLFSVSIGLPFLEHCMVGIMQYGLFRLPSFT